MTNEAEVKITEEELDELFVDESETDVSRETEEKEDVKGDNPEETEDEAKAETEETKEAEPPSDEKDKEEKLVPVAALINERSKRQQLQEENERLKAQAPKPEVPLPDPIDDPDGYERALRAKIEAENIEKEQLAFKVKAEDSISKMMEEHPDYRKYEDIFMFLAAQDESLKQEMFKSDDPARFAYEEGLAYEETQRAELRAEIEAELKTNDITDNPADKPSARTPSLAKATAADTNAAPRDELKDELDEMFEE